MSEATPNEVETPDQLLTALIQGLEEIAARHDAEIARERAAHGLGSSNMDTILRRHSDELKAAQALIDDARTQRSE